MVVLSLDFFDIRISISSRHVMNVYLTMTGGIDAAAYLPCFVLGPMQGHETAIQLDSNFWLHTADFQVLDPPAIDRAH
jgi:hypothetical protein